MGVETTNNRKSAAGNGVTTIFTFPYKFLLNADLVVIVRNNTTGVEVTKTLTTHYTVTGAGDDAGGSVTMLVAPAAGETLVIYNDPAITQGVDLRENDSSPAEVQEEALDRLTLISQRLSNRVDRAIRLSEGFSPAFDTTLPSDLDDSGDKVPLMNPAGDGFAPVSDWPTVTEIQDAEANAAAAAASAAASAVSAGESAASAVASDASADEAAASAIAAQNAVNSIAFRDVVFKTFADSPITIDNTYRGKMVSIDSSGGNVVVNLPTIASLDLTTAFVLGLKKSSSDGNTITVNRGGSDTIDGGTSKAITTPASGSVLVPDVDPSPDRWTSADFGASAGNLTVDRFSGTGSQTAFVLSVDPGSENNTQVYVGGVYQQKDTYSLTGTTLTFSEAPPTGTDNIEVTSGTTLSVGVPSDATVTTPKIADGNVTRAKLATGARAPATSTSKTTTYTATDDDDTLRLSGASWTLTLPTAVGRSGKRFKILHQGTNFSQVYTLQTTSSQTIGGIAGGSYALYTNGEMLEVESDGANWIIIGRITDTAWAAYTPTLTGFGTATSVDFIWRRRAGAMDIIGKFVGGTTTAVEARATLPGGTSAGSPILSSLQSIGVGCYGNGTSGQPRALIEPSVAYLTFGYQETSQPGLSKANGSSILNSSSTFQFHANSIPMANWQP